MILIIVLRNRELENIVIFAGDLPECARLSGNIDESFDDRDLQRALEDSSRDVKKQRQHGECVSVCFLF